MTYRGLIVVLVAVIMTLLVPTFSSAAPAGTDAVDRSDSASRSALAQAPAGTAVFDVTAYGARGDGSGDDVPAIQAAVDAAVAAGGGVVHLPAGTYRLESGRLLDDPLAPMAANLPLMDGVTYEGDGIGRTVLVMAAPSYVSCFGSIGGTDVHVKDLSIIADRSLHASDGDGIKLEGVTDSSFTNVAAENQYIAFAIIGCTRIRLTGCVARATSLNFSISVADAFPVCKSVLVDRCRSFDSEQCGFWAYHDDGDDSTRVRRVVFKDCYAAGNAGAGFYTKWSADTAFLDCTSVSNAWGFYVVHAKDYVLSSCVAQGNAGSNALPYNAGHSRPRLGSLLFVLRQASW